MHRTFISLTIFAAWITAAIPTALGQTAVAAKPVAAAAVEPAWIARSNRYTQTLLDIQLRHSPEGGSAEGLAKYDTSITDATRADEIAQRKELEDELADLKKGEAKEKNQDVREDLEILQKTFNLQFRRDDYRLSIRFRF